MAQTVPEIRYLSLGPSNDHELVIARFVDQIDTEGRLSLSAAVARLQQATGAAGTVALKLMTDPNVPAAVRLRAAEFVFANAIKGIEVGDFDERLTEVERVTETAKDRRLR